MIQIGKVIKLGGEIKIEALDAQIIKDLLMSLKDTKEIEYDNRIAYGANPNGREMIALQDEINLAKRYYKMLDRKIQRT